MLVKECDWDGLKTLRQTGIKERDYSLPGDTPSPIRIYLGGPVVADAIRMKKAKKAIMVSLLLLGVIVVALNVLAYKQAYAMMHFTTQGARTREPERLPGMAKLKVLFSGINIPRPTSAVLPSAVDPDCHPFFISDPDGIRLACWYCDRGRETPLVVLFHGYSAEKSSLVEEAKAFFALGASVLLVDFRGSGGSSEGYTTIGVREAHDVTTVVRYAREQLPHARVICFGQSMGAVAILRAVSHDGVAPDAVILEAVFDTMLNTVCNRFAAMHVPSFPSAQLLVFWGGWQWQFNGFRHNPVDYAKALKCPALFMHGSDDPRARIAEGRRVCEAVCGDKTFLAFQNIGHQSYVAAHRVEWSAAVENLMNNAENRQHRDATCLSGGAPSPHSPRVRGLETADARPTA